ncbi:MAG: transporter substrate-binding domain-containing protein [Spirochaetaceae bacterium]|nr:transporter substrate-binding domain-containing protein [Spirochaetaceae bacterium]
MKLNKAALVAALLLAISGGLYAKGKQDAGGLTITPGVLKVGMEIGYPPMEYYDTDGNTPIGFDVQLAAAIAEQLELRVEYIDTAWDGIFAGVETGKYDLIISSVTITPERRQKYIFPGAYISNAQAIVLPEGSRRTVRRPEDLAGLRVAYQSETTSDYVMRDYAAQGLSFQAFGYDKVINCFDELRAGRVDAVICDSVVAYFYNANAAYPVTIVWEGEGEELGVCIRGGNTALGDAVSEALRVLFADGTVQRLSQNIFGRDLVSSVRR